MARDENQSYRWDVYIAAGFGAFCLALGDLVKNDKSSTVIRLSEAIRTHLISYLGEGALCALVLLILLGIIVCWIHEPSNRVEGFARGFSVFAVIAVASPAVQNQASLTDVNASNMDNGVSVTSPKNLEKHYRKSPISLFVSSAFAQTFTKENIKGEAIIILPRVNNDSNSLATVTLRDVDSQKVIARQDIDGSEFRIIKPYGNYIIEIEKQGYRRTEVYITIDKPVAAFELPISESNVPLIIQKLLGTSKGNLLFSPEETKKYTELPRKEFEMFGYNEKQNYVDYVVGQYLKNYWFNDSYKKNIDLREIAVADINIDKISDQKDISAKDCENQLMVAVSSALKEPWSSFKEIPNNEKAKYILMLAITEITPGNSRDRLWVGEVGIGKAKVKVDGLLVDILQRERVARFSVPMSSTGSGGVRDIGNDIGSTLVKELLEKIGSDIIKELSNSVRN